jgi:hypothetical protein
MPTVKFNPTPRVLLEQNTGEAFATKTQKTVLSQEPAATEAWSVSAIIFQLNATYEELYFVHTRTAYKGLEENLAALELQKTANKERGELLVKQEKELLEQYIEAREARESANANSEEKKTHEAAAQAYEARAAFFAVVAAVEAARGEQKANTETFQQLARDKAQLERELGELGLQTAREGLTETPLTVFARITVNGELVFAGRLESNRVRQPESAFEVGANTFLGFIYAEKALLYTSLQNPIFIPEHGNVELEYEILGPAAIVGEEGPTFGKERITLGKKGIELEAKLVYNLAAPARYLQQ